MPRPPAPGSPRGRASHRPCRPPAPGAPLQPARASRHPRRPPTPCALNCVTADHRRHRPPQSLAATSLWRLRPGSLPPLPAPARLSLLLTIYFLPSAVPSSSDIKPATITRHHRPSPCRSPHTPRAPQHISHCPLAGPRPPHPRHHPRSRSHPRPTAPVPAHGWRHAPPPPAHPHPRHSVPAVPQLPLKSSPSSSPSDPSPPS